MIYSNHPLLPPPLHESNSASIYHIQLKIRGERMLACVDLTRLRHEEDVFLDPLMNNVLENLV